MATARADEKIRETPPPSRAPADDQWRACREMPSGSPSKWVRCRWRPPEPTKNSGNHHVLIGLRQFAQRRSWFTTLQEHSTSTIIRKKYSYRRVPVPEAQPLQFMLRFHMRHRDLQYRRRPVDEPCGCDPRATDIFGVEGGFQHQ